MHYVFYETGNDVFFSHVIETFCNLVVNKIAEYYNNNRGDFVRPGDILLDRKLVTKFFEKKKKEFIPLSCILFDAMVPCGDQICKNDYKAVLASDQREKISHIMKDTINTFKNNFAGDSRDRLNIQDILQYHDIIDMQAVEEIPISSRKNPINYKNSDTQRHRRLYAAKASRMRRKADAEGFVYVRSITGSHYNYFAARTQLSNLTPCDALQAIP